ncbi:MAG: TolC family protein, partial [Candidatus Acidiferrum sp.]
MSPTLQSALMNAKVARENRVQEWSANLPSVTGVSTYLYTEGNGTLAARFIANNGVHEYIAQADAHELLSAAQVVQYRRSILSDTLARDQASVAQRGLVVTVVQSYAALVAAENKYKTLQQALEAARDFVKTTEQLEKGGEVAHADVLKARIQFADSEVAGENAQLARESARLTLALLLFPDVNQKFEAVDDLGRLLVLPSFEEAQAAALQHNPSLDASRDSERLASEDVTYAKTGYLPTLTFDYFYGIDANQFAARTETRLGPIQNLGYSAMATLNVPLWN